jgi:hypothetical protein
MLIEKKRKKYSFGTSNDLGRTKVHQIQKDG